MQSPESDEQPTSENLPAFAPDLGGPPSKYDQDLANRICEMMAEGKSLRRICAEPGMPHRTTIMRWRAEHDEFASAYMVAIACFAEDEMMECIHIADDASKDFELTEAEEGMPLVKFNKEAPVRTQQRIDTRLAVVAKLMPRRYGETPVVAEYDPTPARNGDDAKVINPDQPDGSNVTIIEQHPLYAQVQASREARKRG